MDGFWKSIGEYAAKQPFEAIVVLLVIILCFTQGHYWLDVILRHSRECRRIITDERHRQAQTDREIKEQKARKARRRKRTQ